MEYDELLVKYVGEFGCYQRILVILICLVGIPFAFNTMSIVFTMGVPEQINCAAPQLNHLNLSVASKLNASIPLVKDEYGTVTYSQCYMYDRNYSSLQHNDIHLVDTSNLSSVQCQHGWEYRTQFYESTAVMEWDLVCDSSWLRATSSSVYMAGLMVGVILFGTFSDTFGRRPALITALLLMVVTSISTAFVQNYTLFIVLRFLAAMATIAQYTIGLVVGIELVGPSWRVHTATGVQYMWAVGYMLLAGIAFFVRDWRALQLALSVPLSLFLVFMWCIPESPRWLYANNKHTTADKIVKKFAKFNKTEVPEKLNIEIQTETRPPLWKIFKTPELRCRSLITFFIWFVNGAVYFGVSLNTSNLGGNPYLNFFIAGGVEIPAYICTQIITTKLGRRLSLSGSLTMTGVSLLLVAIIPKGMDMAAISLAMCGKFAITIAFAVLYIITAELYPTKMRNVTVGAASCCARFGAVLAPYIAELAQIARYIPPVTFGVLGVSAGLLTLLLPETMNQSLPETLEDMENFTKPEKRDASKCNGKNAICANCVADSSLE